MPPSSKPLPVGSPFSKSSRSTPPASPGTRDSRWQVLTDIRGNLRILVALALLWWILVIVGAVFGAIEYVAMQDRVACLVEHADSGIAHLLCD